MATKSRRSKARIVPRAKIWLEADGEYVFGHGLSEILKAIEEAGSIKEAAGIVGKSYRHIWSRVKEAEQALGVTLVETQVGGGPSQRSHITKPAKLLIREYDRMRARIFDLVEKKFTATLRTIARAKDLNRD